MRHNSSVSRADVHDGDESLDVVVSHLRSEATRMSVILRAATGRLEQRQEALHSLRRRKLTLHVPREHEAP